MNRFLLTLVPFLCLAAGACGPGQVGDSCKEDADCDDVAGLVWPKDADATADDKGTCEEDGAAS